MLRRIPTVMNRCRCRSLRRSPMGLRKDSAGKWWSAKPPLALDDCGRNEQPSDMKLIADNWDTLLPAAELGFEEHGRGTLLVDTTRIENGGYPFDTSVSMVFRTTMLTADVRCELMIPRKRASSACSGPMDECIRICSGARVMPR